MAKISINPAPTFKAAVDIPVPGGTPITMEFTFKHRTQDEFNAFLQSRKDKTDAESFLEMVVGWDFAEEFNAASVATMLQNYMGAALPTYQKYVGEFLKAKAKNLEPSL